MNGVAQTYTDGPSNQVDVIDTQGGRILCVADVRGKLSTLNALAIEHNAKAIIHTGDFGFYEPASLARVSDRTLKHLVQYSNLITPAFRSALLAPNVQPSQLRSMLTAGPSSGAGSSSASSSNPQFALSEFPQLLTGELKFVVPVYTVWGACEDVSVLERLRVAPPGAVNVPSSASAAQQSGPAQQANWSIPNLTVLSESCSRALVIGNVRFRLFGLGGACVQHKLFDNGEGQATIAGGGGTMWTTMLQIGELVDTAQRVYDPTETRVLITHASPGREGMLAQLGLVIKADLTISASLHFRYGVSYNEFSVQHDQAAYRNKFQIAKSAFNEVWDTVKSQVEAVIDDQQRKFLNNALAVVNRLPSEASPSDQQNNRVDEEAAWKNTWNWNLPDAAFGSLVLDVKDGRVSSEMKSQGFNFSYRAAQTKPVPTGPAANANVPSGPSKQHQNQKSGSAPSGPKHQQQQNRPPPQQSSSQQQQANRDSKPNVAQAKPQSGATDVSSAPPATAGDSKDAAPANASLANTGSANTAAPDRPNSSGSRRPSQQHKSRSYSKDENAHPTDSEAGNSSAAESASGRGGRDFGRGRGRGRGRGGEGRGGFDGPKRGRGGPYRGGHSGRPDSGSSTPPVSSSQQSASSPAAAKSESTSAPAPKSSEAKANGVGWE